MGKMLGKEEMKIHLNQRDRKLELHLLSCHRPLPTPSLGTVPCGSTDVAGELSSVFARSSSSSFWLIAQIGFPTKVSLYPRPAFLRRRVGLQWCDYSLMAAATQPCATLPMISLAAVRRIPAGWLWIRWSRRHLSYLCHTL